MHEIRTFGDGLSFTLDKVKYDEFCEIVVNPNINQNEKRRLFISACNAKEDVTQIFDKKDNTFISIIAPSKTIKTRIAPLVWATFL